jgi:uncharacterized Zn-binding protein involved in type VI secretion
MPKIATQGDKVVGTDTHIVMVPSPSGPVPTSLPHPFQGTIVNGCDESVTINGKPVALVGAEAMNDTPHVPTPPGTSFQKPPKNRSVVKKAIKSIEINGKYAVLEGNPAMNCNDPEDAPTGIVQVIGPSVEWKPLTDWKPIPEFSYNEYVKRKKKKKKEALLRKRHLYSDQKQLNEQKSKIQKEGEIISLKIFDDPIYYGNSLVVQVKSTGIFYKELTLRKVILDSFGKWISIDESNTFYIGKKNIKYLILPELRFNEEDFQKIPPYSRLFIYFEILREGEVIYELPNHEMKEIFMKFRIKFHYKKSPNKKSKGNIGLDHSNSDQMEYVTRNFSETYLRIKKIPGGRLRLLQSRQEAMDYDLFQDT